MKNNLSKKKKRFTYIGSVYLILIHNGQVLLSRRFNTGYEDGKYGLVAGHMDGNESPTTAMIREAREEVGLKLQARDLQMVHVMHRKQEDERIDFFFTASKWEGEPVNMEPDRCDDLSWFPLSELPTNIIPFIQIALTHFKNKETYSEFGWD